MRISFDAWREEVQRAVSNCRSETLTFLLTWQETSNAAPEKILPAELDREAPRPGVYRLQYTDKGGDVVVHEVIREAPREPAGPMGLHAIEQDVWAKTLLRVSQQNDVYALENKTLHSELIDLRREIKILRERETEGGLFDETTVGLILKICEQYFGAADLREAVVTMIERVDKDPVLRKRFLKKMPDVVALLGAAVNGDGAEAEAA